MTHASHAHAGAHGKNPQHAHAVPLWGLFLALLALTAAEVALFEIWHRTDLAGEPFIPKFAMVLLLLIFTLPKAAIVLIYFMHLKFEKQLVVALAIIPFFFVFVAVLPVLSDIKTLKGKGQTYNIIEGLGREPAHDAHGDAGHGKPAESPEEVY